MYVGDLLLRSSCENVVIQQCRRMVYNIVIIAIAIEVHWLQAGGRIRREREREGESQVEETVVVAERATAVAAGRFLETQVTIWQ
jgi:hypothetical protein